MKLNRHLLCHCASVALLIDSSACMSSNDGSGEAGEVQATGESQDLLFARRHKKKTHWDDCDKPVSCESVALEVASFHRKASRDLEHEIRVSVPAKLPALYWGAGVEAELVFEQDDKNVVCHYTSEPHKREQLFRSLELESCDNGAKAGDAISIDSATLRLGECDAFSFAKVYIKLEELEPCGDNGGECPANIDDGNPCTIDACDSAGKVTHNTVADGTSCDDGNVCNGHECCQAGSCTNKISAPLECPGDSGSMLVFQTMFDGPLPAEIDPGTAMLTPVQGYGGLGAVGNKFGGNFLRSPTAQVVTVHLTGLPTHDQLDLRFLFAAIDSLDGTGAYPAGDQFIVKLDGVTIFSQSFANALPTQVQSYVAPADVELARRLPLGFHDGDSSSYYSDSAYDLSQDPQFLGINHTASTATITFELSGEGAQPLDDESWAIDNLEISVSKAGACEQCGITPPVVDDNNPCTIDSCDPVMGVRHEFADRDTVCGNSSNVCVQASKCDGQGVCRPGMPTPSVPCNSASEGPGQCDTEGMCVPFS